MTRTRVWFGILLAGLAVSDGAALQWETAGRPRDPLALLGGTWSASLEPAGGFAAGRAETRIHALLQWSPTGASAWSLGLSATGVRGRVSWTGAGADLRRTWGRDRRAAWLGTELVMAAGEGARYAVQAYAAGRLGALTLEMRSAWLDPMPGDTFTPAGLDRFEPSLRRYTESELSARIPVGHATLGARAGLRFGGPDVRDEWLGGSFELPVHRRADLVASGGRRPARPERGEPAGAFGLLAVRLRPDDGATPGPAAAPDPRDAPAPEDVPAVRVRPGPADRWLIELRLPGARAAEINGDLTGWTARPLERVGADTWRFSITAPPGLYHVVVRADEGPWRAPDGLPVVPDGYGGATGLLHLH